MLEVGEIRYNVQEKVEVFAYIFHNLSWSKLTFLISKAQFHLHASVVPISHV